MGFLAVILELLANVIAVHPLFHVANLHLRVSVGCRVQGAGCRVQGVGCRLRVEGWGLGCILAIGLMVRVRVGVRFRVRFRVIECEQYSVTGLGFRVSVTGLGLRVRALARFRARFRVGAVKCYGQALPNPL